MPNEQDLSVGQLAARSGVSVSALHFYEREGLIRSRRTPGNQRRYNRSILRRVAVIRAAQRAGIPLSAVSDAFAELPRDGVPDQEDWQRMSAAWQQELAQRISQLEHLRDRLGGCIGCGCLSLSMCSFVNPDDAAARRGDASTLLEPDRPT
ncbi:redox-sensitive transcriptional activator SoxR [Arthrobacter echini]|uniref:Redox-sensitive transcriptional activator SoxR n=1 Tax=Arthrobacter echini TaxID=1529066 RepID=A0A4S5E3B4_9MICC|nr:redox-sensitive transcriptional activator SoxR [Arthrobacter echini]THJ65860.1 redox-sensitive transcriptional activator SoxR [Arthrobacter echini]